MKEYIGQEQTFQEPVSLRPVASIGRIEPPESEPRSQVLSIVERLEKEMAALDGCIADVEQRLGPILRGDKYKERPEVQTPKNDGLAPLAETLRAISIQTRCVGERLLRLRDRIAL